MNVWQLIFRSLRRHTTQSIFAVFGIVLGVSVLLFFAALSEGVKQNVLQHIVADRYLEVVPRTVQLGGIQRRGGLFGGSGSGLEDFTIQDLLAIEGVVAAYPKQQLSFPSLVRGGESILGEAMWAELVADGIDPVYAEVDAAEPLLAFKDWAGVTDCSDDGACGTAAQCVDGQCKRQGCTPLRPCPEGSYCDGGSRRCEMPVPVVISPSLLELYNGSVQSVFRGMKGRTAPPRLSADALIGFSLTAELGKGMLGSSVAVSEGRRPVRSVPLRLVGFSPQAIALGATVPRGYIQRWNAEYGTPGSERDYSSIVLELRRSQDLNPVIDAVRNELNLDVHPRYEMARKAAGMIGLILLIFSMLAALIVAVGALQIAQIFALRNHERRREFGVMRSLGASSINLLAMLLGEAVVLGLIAGLVAIPSALAAAKLANWAFTRFSPDFPFKPASLFLFQPEWWLIGMTLAVSAAVVGALIPALRVARMDAGDALRERD